MATKQKQLKPCPFCGSKSVRRQGGVITGMVMFVCQCCGADVCFYGAERDPHATQAWNRRSENGNL